MNLRNFTFAVLALFVFIHCKGYGNLPNQPKKTKTDSTAVYSKPKLVVGIVVDQMRHDYLTRFWDRFEDDGFKRLINDGYFLKNNHYNYVPTYTAPGHTSIYTGTTPRHHGIISNDWYDKTIDESVYCAQDDSISPVGTDSDAGKMSPNRILATTVTDQNRLATQFRGKTIGVALKDRGAIMPAGHSANAAYWYRGKNEGNFISSSYYMDELPDWVKAFNSLEKPQDYLKSWETLHPISSYTESGTDENDFEQGYKGKETATFPYDLEGLMEKNDSLDLIYSTPYGNNLTTDFALAAIDGEDLGKDEITDFLTISYSSPDYIGHNFGVNSKEVQDNYLRLDQDIARLLKELDEKIGEGNYTIFLTADHAGVNVPSYLKSKKIKADYFDTEKLNDKLKNLVKEEFGSADLIKNISNRQIFFDYEVLKEEQIDNDELAKTLQHFLTNYPKIAQAYTRSMIEGSSFDGMIARRVRKGFNPKRSGDVAYELNPATISYPKQGSTHGSAYKYDTHVPLIFYGQGINNGQTSKPTEIVDIAPTISALLGIAFPNAATGQVLTDVIE